jgi:hypothetical protein
MNINVRNLKHILAIIIMGCALFYVIILPFLSLIVKYPIIFGKISLNPELRILLQLSINTIVMVGSVFVWLRLIHDHKINEILKALKLKEVKNTPIAIIYGLSSSILFLICMIIVLLIISVLTGFKQENALAIWIGESLSWLGIFIVAILSAFSEEIFFRGYLQERIGLIPAAILFGVVHISYQNIIQIIAPIIFGILLGILLIKTKNLYSSISAHFSFNLIQLSFIKILTMIFWLKVYISFN